MNHLKKITPEAKRLYKTGRYKKYSDAVKAAFAKHPVKHKKKAAAGRIVHKKHTRAAHTVKHHHSVNLGVGTISGHENAIKKLLKSELGRLYVCRDYAKTKAEKRKYQREIIDIKKKIRSNS